MIKIANLVFYYAYKTYFEFYFFNLGLFLYAMLADDEIKIYFPQTQV